MPALNELPEMKSFFSGLFQFIRKYHIHSFLDHMSDYSVLQEILLSSQLEELRYYPRLDQYSFRLCNKENRLVDQVYMFCFGSPNDGKNDQQVLITLNNEKIYAELSITDTREIPVMCYAKTQRHKSLTRLFHRTEPKREQMTLQDWEDFLSAHNMQYPRRMK